MRSDQSNFADWLLSTLQFRRHWGNTPNFCVTGRHEVPLQETAVGAMLTGVATCELRAGVTQQRDQPGAGLPEYERAVISGILRFGSAVMSDLRALNLFSREADRILTLIDEVDIDQASHPVRVPRFRGMEESSCHWSLLMVCHHLCLVNREILTAIESLKHGIRPFGAVSIAEYKPDPDVGMDVVDEFRQLTNDYSVFVNNNRPLRTQQRFAHPWFGELDGHQWHCLAAFHQQIHRRQAQKILALDGIA